MKKVKNSSPSFCCGVAQPRGILVSRIYQGLLWIEQHPESEHCSNVSKDIMSLRQQIINPAYKLRKRWNDVYWQGSADFPRWFKTT